MLRTHIPYIVTAAIASLLLAYSYMHSSNPRLSQISAAVMTATRPVASTVPQHLTGSVQSWHGQITEDGPFLPEKDRYHLYIGLFCPFAHRVNLVRQLYGLQDLLPLSVVKPYPKGDEKGWPGWQFPSSDAEYPNATVDHVFGSTYLHEVYFRADGEYKGRYSVPLLWDKKTNTIVNNESAEILRWLPHAFDSLTGGRKDLELYPEDLKPKIDEVTEWMHRDLNRGVYKAGFATTQEDYDKNVILVFAALNKLEVLIASNGGPFILGERLTELDITAYVTIVRFDTVYVQHFKCNLGTIRHDYPQINGWLTRLYSRVPGFKETTNFKHIKENYTKSHYDINPRAITPRGPWPDVEQDDGKSVNETRTGGITMPEVLEAMKLPASG